jgi:adenylosuccinate synthase
MLPAIPLIHPAFPLPCLAQVVYETLPGWQQDISKARSWEDLPENARK